MMRSAFGSLGTRPPKRSIKPAQTAGMLTMPPVARHSAMSRRSSLSRLPQYGINLAEAAIDDILRCRFQVVSRYPYRQVPSSPAAAQIVFDEHEMIVSGRKLDFGQFTFGLAASSMLPAAPWKTRPLIYAAWRAHL